MTNIKNDWHFIAHITFFKSEKHELTTGENPIQIVGLKPDTGRIQTIAIDDS